MVVKVIMFEPANTAEFDGYIKLFPKAKASIIVYFDCCIGMAVMVA